MPGVRSSNLYRFEEWTDSVALPASVATLISELTQTLDALDLYTHLVGDLPTYAPLAGIIQRMYDPVEEGVGWVNRYLDSQVDLECMHAGLDAAASEDLIWCMNSLRKLSLDLPRRQMESFLSFICEDDPESLLKDDSTSFEKSEDGDATPCELGDLIGVICEDDPESLLKDDSTPFEESADGDATPCELDDLIGDPAITYPFLHAVNGVLNDTECLARRITTDLQEKARDLRALFSCINSR